MAFTKSFPKTSDKSTYPKWIEISLTDEEEKQQEQLARSTNIKLMKECIDDAKKIIIDKALASNQEDMVKIAISLFEKRASHEIYFKENKAKEKFDFLNTQTNSHL
ncbi:MAG: hypothetical protein ABII01_00480 [Candidatus Woesearchaeota archaeon]